MADERLPAPTQEPLTDADVDAINLHDAAAQREQSDQDIRAINEEGLSADPVAAHNQIALRHAVDVTRQDALRRIDEIEGQTLVIVDTAPRV